MSNLSDAEKNRLEMIKEQLLSVADKPPRTEVMLTQDDITFLCQM